MIPTVPSLTLAEPVERSLGVPFQRNSALHGDDNLADLLVRLQETVGFDDLVEWECLGNERLEPSVGETFVDELLAAFEALWIESDFHHHVAADRQPASQDLEQRERSRFRAQRAVDE